MTIKQTRETSPIIAVAGAGVFALAGSFLAGLISADASFGLSRIGISFPLREPLNLAIAALFYFFWQQLKRAQTNSSIYDLDHEKKISFGGIAALFWGAIAAIIILAITWGILIFAQQCETLLPKSNMALGLVPTLFLAAIFIFIHGLAEQLLIGLIGQNIAAKFYGQFAGILIGAFVFMALQTLQGYKGFAYMFSSFAFGLVLSILAQKFGLLAAASLHGFWTWIETALVPQFYEIHFKDNIFAGGTSDSYHSLCFGLVCMAMAAALYFGLGLCESFNYKLNYDKSEHKP